MIVDAFVGKDLLDLILGYFLLSLVISPERFVDFSFVSLCYVVRLECIFLLMSHVEQE